MSHKDIEDDQENELERYGLMPCNEIGSFTCTHHSHAPSILFAGRKSFVAHFRKYIHVLAGAREELWNVAQSISRRFPELNSLREKYRVGGFDNGELPQLPGLEIIDARKCPTCNYLSESVDNLRISVRKLHVITLNRDYVRSLPILKCQSLSASRKNTNFFIVSDNEGESRSAPTSLLSTVKKRLDKSQDFESFQVNDDRRNCLETDTIRLSNFASMENCTGRLDAIGSTHSSAAILG